MSGENKSPNKDMVVECSRCEELIKIIERKTAEIVKYKEILHEKE